MTSHIAALIGLSPREAIVDALYRFLLAYDINDQRLLRSAVTDDVQFAIPAFDIETNSLDDVLVNFMKIAPLCTGHVVGNARVQYDDSRDARKAAFSAIGLNNHIRPADQEAQQMPPHFLVCFQYDVHVVYDDAASLWKISKLMSTPLYRTGDTSIVQEG